MFILDIPSLRANKEYPFGAGKGMGNVHYIPDNKGALGLPEVSAKENRENYRPGVKESMGTPQAVSKDQREHQMRKLEQEREQTEPIKSDPLGFYNGLKDFTKHKQRPGTNPNLDPAILYMRGLENLREQNKKLLQEQR